MSDLKYKRVLLKVSGEALMGNDAYGHNTEAITRICRDIKEVKEMGCEVCLVVGGGNICRGAEVAQMGIERSSADYMGMLATVMNAIAIQSRLEQLGVFSPRAVCYSYDNDL